MGHETLGSTGRYKSFVSQRDKALEQIHHNTELDISRMLFDAFDQIEGHVAKQITQYDAHVYHMNFLSTQLDGFITHVFSSKYVQIFNRILTMRKALFTLTYASEMESIGRASQRAKQVNRQEFKQKLAKTLTTKTLQNEDLGKRLWLSFMRLKYRILSAFNLAIVQEIPLKEVLEKLKKAFPPIVSYKRLPRELKPLQEANQPKDKKSLVDLDFIDPDDWELMVQAYKDTELPPSRFDRSPQIDPEAGYYKYDWELEQDVTDEFVKQVRDGQIDAANDLGIKEFVWVAIIDDKTDECCLKRNGHTTSEIEEMLSNGKLKADQCDATSPPAHPNCRCQISPIASSDEVQGPDWQSFGEWLGS